MPFGPLKFKSKESAARHKRGQVHGGYARVDKMTPEELSAACRKAVQARWARYYAARAEEAATQRNGKRA